MSVGTQKAIPLETPTSEGIRKRDGFEQVFRAGTQSTRHREGGPRILAPLRCPLASRLGCTALTSDSTPKSAARAHPQALHLGSNSVVPIFRLFLPRRLFGPGPVSRPISSFGQLSSSIAFRDVRHATGLSPSFSKSQIQSIFNPALNRQPEHIFVPHIGGTQDVAD